MDEYRVIRDDGMLYMQTDRDTALRLVRQLNELSAGQLQKVALAKGLAAGRDRCLSADTIVWFDGRIYGKPRDLDEARRFLRELEGKTHSVFTGTAFDGDVKVVRSDVKFRKLSEAL